MKKEENQVPCKFVSAKATAHSRYEIKVRVNAPASLWYDFYLKLKEREHLWFDVTEENPAGYSFPIPIYGRILGLKWTGEHLEVDVLDILNFHKSFAPRKFLEKLRNAFRSD